MNNLRLIGNQFFIGGQFHHIGVACQDIEQTSSFLMPFLPEAVRVSEVIYDPNIDASLKLLEFQRGGFFELVSGGITANFVRKAQFVYHVCFEFDSLEIFERNVPQANILPITEPMPALLFENRLVQFFRTPIGLVEILESGRR